MVHVIVYWNPKGISSKDNQKAFYLVTWQQFALDPIRSRLCKVCKHIKWNDFIEVDYKFAYFPSFSSIKLNSTWFQLIIVILYLMWPKSVLYVLLQTFLLTIMNNYTGKRMASSIFFSCYFKSMHDFISDMNLTSVWFLVALSINYVYNKPINQIRF